MKSIGTITASLAHQKNISQELAKVIGEGLERSDQKSFSETFPKRKLDYAGIVDATSLCESPIEKIMLAGMLTMPSDVAPVVHDPMSGEPFPVHALVVTPQFVIARYRLDFLVTVQRLKAPPCSFAVECDGIQFHGSLDKRKSDYERDLYLNAIGIKTVRYYGQEIKQLGFKCADDVAAIVNSLVK